VKAVTNGKCACACPCNGKAEKKTASGEPDFRTMSPAEKVAWHRARWDRILGS
jgi:hypothetical protein